MNTSLSRRAVIIAGAGAVIASGIGVALGTTGQGSEHTNDGDLAGSRTRTDFPEFEEGSFTSSSRGGENTHWSIQRPGGVRTALHPVILLHDVGGSHIAQIPKTDLGLAEALTLSVSKEVTPFALCSVDSQMSQSLSANPSAMSPDSYYHARVGQNGTLDSGKMILEEFIPLIARKGINTSKIAFWGWGMGGYGALRLGALYEKAHPGSVVGIVATSPALGIRNPPEAGSFDNNADYRNNSVFNYVDTLQGLSLRIDSGTSGKYVDGSRELIRQLSPAQPQGGIQPGGSENPDFIRSLITKQMEFLGQCFEAK